MIQVNIDTYITHFLENQCVGLKFCNLTLGKYVTTISCYFVSKPVLLVFIINLWLR